MIVILNDNQLIDCRCKEFAIVNDLLYLKKDDKWGMYGKVKVQIKKLDDLVNNWDEISNQLCYNETMREKR